MLGIEIEKIRRDYAELIIKPENKDDLGKLSELAAFRDNSVSDNCDEKSRQIEAIISGIDDDLNEIAEIHDVTPEEISTGHAEALEKSIRLPRSCTQFYRIMLPQLLNFLEKLTLLIGV